MIFLRQPRVGGVVHIRGYIARADSVTENAIGAEFGGKGFGVFKPALADLAVEKLAPISGEMKRLMDDPAEIDRILLAGASTATRSYWNCLFLLLPWLADGS